LPAIHVAQFLSVSHRHATIIPMPDPANDSHAKQCGVCKNYFDRSGYSKYRKDRRRSICDSCYLNPPAPISYDPAKNYASRMVNHARARAKRHGIYFAITKSDISIPSHCPILGIPLEVGRGYARDSSPSLDRINPNKGYLPDNIWVISMKANRMKGDMTLGILRDMVSAVEPRWKDWRVGT
jgi:hypothetical protein